jgi:DNA-3-methyladenine glycosylase II
LIGQPNGFAVVVRPIPPFRLDLTVWALRRRSRNVIDRWDGATYRRVVILGNTPTELAVRQEGPIAAPRLVVNATPTPRASSDRRRVRWLVGRLLGPRIDLTDWYRTASEDALLGPLATTFSGMKPPRFPTAFEAVVNAFACQQLSLEVGLELLNRLAALCGARVGTGSDVRHAFPTAQDVARVSLEKCRAIGFSRQKAKALVSLAQSITRGELDLEVLAQQDDKEVILQRLLELRGIGRWTAEYVLLRGLGRLDVFPGDDVGAQNALARWTGRSQRPDYAAVSRVVKQWSPFAGLVYFHLLLRGLSRAGVLEPTMSHSLAKKIRRVADST